MSSITLTLKNREYMESAWQKMKNKWGIKHNYELIVILTVFALTGSCSVVVSSPIVDYLNSYFQWSGWLAFFLKIILVTPIYLVLLVSIGTLLGQRVFFWNFAKKMVSNMGRLFGFNRK
ncbi:MAG: DUF6787 family protein [Chitinophagales bacterium]